LRGDCNAFTLSLAINRVDCKGANRRAGRRRTRTEQLKGPSPIALVPSRSHCNGFWALQVSASRKRHARRQASSVKCAVLPALRASMRAPCRPLLLKGTRWGRRLVAPLEVGCKGLALLQVVCFCLCRDVLLSGSQDGGMHQGAGDHHIRVQAHLHASRPTRGKSEMCQLRATPLRAIRSAIRPAIRSATICNNIASAAAAHRDMLKHAVTAAACKDVWI
jgi:hypothetical protein